MTNHCENCGKENPTLNSDGYTECCNELVCDGRHQSDFGNADFSVKSCCWGKAFDKFREQGQEIVNGMYRKDADEEWYR